MFNTMHEILIQNKFITISPSISTAKERTALPLLADFVSTVNNGIYLGEE